MSARDTTPPDVTKLTPEKERILACYDAMNAFAAGRLLETAIEFQKAFPAPKPCAGLRLVSGRTSETKTGGRA